MKATTGIACINRPISDTFIHVYAVVHWTVFVFFTLQKCKIEGESVSKSYV